MTSEPKYNQLRRCPKCGTAGVGTTFVADIYREQLFSAGALVGFARKAKDEADAERWEKRIREHVPTPRMQRDCFNCKHSWYEIPKDVEA